MEQKGILLSALGVGVGVGLGLASAQNVGKWVGFGSLPLNGITPERMEQEMLLLVVDGRDSKVTFDQFPYYLSEQTRVLLCSSAYVHLKNTDGFKFARNLAPASRTILLSGPAEFYQQTLAKALAHYSDAKLLILDVIDFSLKLQSKYGSAKESAFKRSISESTLERLSGFLGSFSMLSPREEPKGYSFAGTLRRQSSGVDLRYRGLEGSANPPKLRTNASASANISALASQSAANPTPLKRTSSWSFDEKLLVHSLYKVLAFVSKTSPVILYLGDADKFVLRSRRIYNLFQKMLDKISGPVLVLGSRILDPHDDSTEVDQNLAALFAYNIEIRPPEEESHLVNWKSQLEEHMKMVQILDNKNHIMEVLSANDLGCDDLDSICLADTMFLNNYIEEIVVSAIFYHLMNNKDPDYRNGKLIISAKSLSHGLRVFQQGKSDGKDTLKLEAKADASKEAGWQGVASVPDTKTASAAPEKKTGTEASAPAAKIGGENPIPAPKAREVLPDNEFEKRIRPEVIPANEIGVTFDDIGALEETKESLQELVMLPLQRPGLFKGGILKPCKGILLFGPPGTGKTMLAKAIAREAGASFINVSMSTITSKWFGEDEKNVRALFTLAAKVSPTIIFVDEVDSMLGQRTRAGEHEAMRKIKNEFMTHWDGLLTNPKERILVLAATNRPFDLDEAIIRRFERSLMVGLPSVENREMILRTLLAKEKVEEGLDYKELATITEGYSGSDLKNLCTTAAYQPVRELIQKERLKDLEKKQRAREGKILESLNTTEVVAMEGHNVGDAADMKESDGEARVISLRPLNMQDFRQAKNQVAASFASEGSVMSELKQWNELYGEGGSRKKQQLTYFL